MSSQLGQSVNCTPWLEAFVNVQRFGMSDTRFGVFVEFLHQLQDFLVRLWT